MDIIFIIKSNGHWSKKGWTYLEQKTESAELAYSLYKKGAPPKAVSVQYPDGFRAALGDEGMKEFFSEFIS